MRRGSAIIRASLYGRIAEVLRGGQGTTRFKNWVKKSEFFLVERIQPGMGYGACLAIPVGRSHTASRKGGSGGGGKAVSVHGGYKLVARLEDFVHIIGAYHNDQKGHHGIRRTYAMVSQPIQLSVSCRVSAPAWSVNGCILAATKLYRTNQ